MPIAQLVQAAAGTRAAERTFSQAISPTLPFYSQSAQDLRGGMPKHDPKPQPRATWEGDAESTMLRILTDVKTAAGETLTQVHISALDNNITGVVLATWASWPSIAHTTSDRPLVIVLPGSRVFELEPPAAPSDSCRRDHATAASCPYRAHHRGGQPPLHRE
eukprot:6468253-Amphidinium_carterae.2